MRLTVMTWNVENLFRPGADAGPDSDAVYENKLETLARTITDLGPDILALQEIGSADSLHDLQQALGGAYPHAELSKHPDGRGIRVGFLSRHALTAPKQVVDFAPNVSLSLQDERGTPITRMRRGALSVETKVDGLTVHLITAHMKSKLLTFPGGRFSTTDENLRARAASLALAERAQEALTLRRTVSDMLKTNPDDALLLLGDLNDVPEAASSQILLGPEGSHPDDSPPAAAPSIRATRATARACSTSPSSSRSLRATRASTTACRS